MDRIRVASSTGMWLKLLPGDQLIVQQRQLEVVQTRVLESTPLSNTLSEVDLGPANAGQFASLSQVIEYTLRDVVEDSESPQELVRMYVGVDPMGQAVRMWMLDRPDHVRDVYEEDLLPLGSTSPGA